MRLLCSSLFFLFSFCFSYAQENELASRQRIAIEWRDGERNGTIKVLNGKLNTIKIVKGSGRVKNNYFEFSSTGAARILVEIDSIRNEKGPEPTLISVLTNKTPFSFFLRDVNKPFPVYIPDCAAVVLNDSDNRSFAQVQITIKKRNLKTKLQKIELEQEESFESAAKQNLVQSVPTWLGTSRDFRIFEVNQSTPINPLEANVITPKFAYSPAFLLQWGKTPVSYSYVLGRGTGVEINTSRRLEEGTLPILHSTHTDDDIIYSSTSFVTFEHTPLTAQTVKGTHYLVADKYSIGHVLTEEQEQYAQAHLKEAFDSTEETVFYFKSEITNTGAVPRYAWVKTIKPGSFWWDKYPYRFDFSSGFSAYSPDSIFCISKLNGKPLPNEEVAVLLQPGEKVEFEFFLPHAPVTKQRALALSTQSFAEKLSECKAFWQHKLKKAARIHVPESRIEEMLNAGLLHLDLITYGNEPNGTLAPSIGIYSPIGTESAPIIQFYASMGWGDNAKRSLMYFLDKQHKDGFIQNFEGYMVETGAALWSIGEYFRYTRDTPWLRQIEPKVLKSCNFLLQWREGNKADSLRGKGYGMIAGKVGDPNDPYHQFMLNAYAYLGLSRVAEMLSEVDSIQSNRIKNEAETWRKDIRESFFNAMAQAPVVPLGDGTWSPTVSPWTEATGLRALYVNRETFYSHGTFTAPDGLISPLYLVFSDVLDSNEPASTILLRYISELFYQHNAAFSQPYYSRHDWVQAKLGMVKPFLKMYYNTVSALADRETYSFWEHLYHVSPNKTHEEAWFLMQTRWMLFFENGATLRLMNAIPRKWLEDGKTIEMDGVQSYFGSLNVKVTSAIKKGFITATIKCSSDRKPKRVIIRLPHPNGKKAIKITGGVYNPRDETVTVNSFKGEASINLRF